MPGEDPIHLKFDHLAARIDRVENRTDQIEHNIRERKDHAHDLEISLRELTVKTEGMNTTMQHVLTGITGNTKGIRTIEKQISEHIQTEQKQRAEEAERSKQYLIEERRYRLRINISIIAVLISLAGLMIGVWTVSEKLNGGG